ncbi:MAG: hypothetical protein JXQ75_06360 [Phycisphaerae bacterium]|nr:hypothetical protein [Phycisphaerae bacterium]
MLRKGDYRKIQVQLQAFLAERFGDVTVQIGDDIHYHGTNIVITSPAFEGLLPEQRFHHVVRAIPPDFYEQHLRGAGVWFELAPGETGQDLMKMPRSEDIAEQEADILEELRKIEFFKEIGAELAASPQDASIDDFPVSRRVMTRAGLGERDIRRACLFLIRHGGFCDAQVLADIVPRFAQEHAT